MPPLTNRQQPQKSLHTAGLGNSPDGSPVSQHYQQRQSRLLDAGWIVMEWLAKPILLCLLLCLPVALASLDEATTVHPVQPSRDCVRFMTADGGSEWRRLLCFSREFAANWADQFVQFLPYIAEKCEPMANQQAQQECQYRQERRRQKLVEHGLILVIAVVIGAAAL
ncbi:hypothetical protein [Pseudomonas sp.]|uniref:hypothetical protein n=1 Tax=Pseudomonas sp. TaxID=306 RepID=UPI003F2F816F